MDGEKLTANYCSDNNIPYCAGRILVFIAILNQKIIYFLNKKNLKKV